MTTSRLRAQLHRRPARHTARRWTARGLLVLVGLAIAGGIVWAWWPAPVAVDVATVQRAPLDVEVDEDGQTRVRDRFVVYAPITGTLERIAREAGDGVAAGEILARIRPLAPMLLDERTRRATAARLEAALAHLRRAEAAIARTSAAREQTDRDLARSRTLAQHGAITASELEQSETAAQLAMHDLAAATSDRAAAVADVAAVRAELSRDAEAASMRDEQLVLSPASAVILKITRDSSGPVAQGAPLVELGDPHALEVVIDVLSSDAAQIDPGMPVEYDAWGGEPPLDGVVRDVEPSAFTRISALGVEEQRVHVVATLDHPPARVGDGFRVQARIFVWRGAHVLSVPTAAVFRDHGRWAVYVVDGGRARLVPVELGHRGRLTVEIVRGVDEGTEVVAHPSDRVVDGARIVRRADVHETAR